MIRRAAALVLAAVLVAGCAIKVGRSFPSPDPSLITIGKTDKAFLTRVLGDPYQVGLDSGDETWRWFFAEHGASTEISKDLSVRFNADGTVKSYSFMSNFPDDMARIRR